MVASIIGFWTLIVEVLIFGECKVVIMPTLQGRVFVFCGAQRVVESGVCRFKYSMCLILTCRVCVLVL